MASTWTLNNAVEKIADGEKTDTWGQITNRNFDILDRASSGVGTIDLSSSGAAHTLYTTDGTVGDALTDGMYKVLVLSGATQACTITISPNDADKLYFVDNNSGQDCTFSQGSGANVTVGNGKTGIIYANGAGAAAAVVSIIDTTTLASFGITATAAELNYNDITTLGTSQASKVVTADANGVVTFDNGVYEEFTAVTSSSAATTINLRDGTNFGHTLTENTTFAFTNPAASGKVSGFTLKLVQDASASSFAANFPASVKWAGGSAPTPTATANAVDIYIFYTHDGGTTYYGFRAGADLK
jgi:hypothetical protein